MCYNEEISIRVEMRDCAAYNEPFRKHYFNHREDSLMMEPMEYRNMYEILCIWCVNIPVQVRLVWKLIPNTISGSNYYKTRPYTLFINLRVPSECILKDTKYAYK